MRTLDFRKICGVESDYCRAFQEPSWKNRHKRVIIPIPSRFPRQKTHDERKRAQHLSRKVNVFERDCYLSTTLSPLNWSTTCVYSPLLPWSSAVRRFRPAKPNAAPLPSAVPNQRALPVAELHVKTAVGQPAALEKPFRIQPARPQNCGKGRTESSAKRSLTGKPCIDQSTLTKPKQN